MERLTDKLKEIEQYLQELSEIIPENYLDYANDIKTKAACERYFEKIIEAVVDAAFLVIKEKELDIPEDDKEAFDILLNENIISEELAGNLKDAKGMRNLIAHKYGSVDDEVVFRSITEELERDVKSFVKSLKNKLKHE